MVVSSRFAMLSFSAVVAGIIVVLARLEQNLKIINDTSPPMTKRITHTTPKPNIEFAMVDGSTMASSWSYEYREAILSLYNRMHPESCENATLTVFAIGRGGGFGSMFQWTAKMFAAVLASRDGSIVDVRGHLKGYTRNGECGTIITRMMEEEDIGANTARGGWLCFFRTLTSCTTSGNLQQSKTFSWEDRGPTRKKEYNNLTAGLIASIPPVYSELGLGFWWGVIQGYLFRLTPRMSKIVHVAKERMKYYSEKGTPPRIGAHIRMGDKLKDRDSKQRGVNGQPVAYLLQILVIAKEIHKSECKDDKTQCEPVGVYIATDSVAAVEEAIEFGKKHASLLRIVVQPTHTQNASKNNEEMSQVINKDNKAYVMAEEVVVDLQLLQEQEYFIGLCMSQLARMIVGMGTARGVLKRAVALDYNNADKGDQFKLSGKYIKWSAPQLATPD
eukprot:m.304932 g.304932  ORF g.304932 m.304932 type:complete len:445 (-) comp16443_c1_seq6:1215-2549(-)